MLRPAVLSLSLLCQTSYAATSDEQCLVKALNRADANTTVAQLREMCKVVIEAVPNKPAASIAAAVTPPAPVESTDNASAALDRRIVLERAAAQNPFTVLAHRRNYLLPVSYSSHPNEDPYRTLPNQTAEQNASLDHSEAKFQISLKAPVAYDVLTQNDGFMFAFTGVSWWQVYNENISAPFRETNYEPEFFYQLPYSKSILGLPFKGLMLGVSHQSNGQSQPLSRSWNRVFADFIFAGDDYAFSIRPWYRLREDDKSDIFDPKGDDNPDIEYYLGHFEFSGVYNLGDHELSMMLRNNLRSDNKGAIQIDWTFPLFGHMRGYTQYFNGYGESLLDYNVSMERIGFGILLTDTL